MFFLGLSLEQAGLKQARWPGEDVDVASWSRFLKGVATTPKTETGDFPWPGVVATP